MTRPGQGEPRKILLTGPVGAYATIWARRFARDQTLWLEREGEIRSVRHMAWLPESFGLTSPFRAPHHTVSLRGLSGSLEKGWRYRPGELHLAHGGVLFLDVANHFSRAALELVATAYAQRQLVLSSTGGSITVPLTFSLVLYVSSCPCGNKGSRHAANECRCTSEQFERHFEPVSQIARDAERIELTEEETHTLRVAVDRADAIGDAL